MDNEQKTEKVIQMQLRLPEGLHAALRERAKEERRSMHSQALHELERALADEPAGEQRKAA